MQTLTFRETFKHQPALLADLKFILIVKDVVARP